MKEKKGRLYKFYGKLTIRNKLLISCLPFVVLGYFLIFYSTTVIMFDQMKQMVYDQTEQNVMEKKKLVNTLLDNYNQATIKFLYYTDEVQEYLNTRQSVLSVEEQEKLTDMISYQIKLTIQAVQRRFDLLRLIPHDDNRFTPRLQICRDYLPNHRRSCPRQPLLESTHAGRKSGGENNDVQIEALAGPHRLQ